MRRRTRGGGSHRQGSAKRRRGAAVGARRGRHRDGRAFLAQLAEELEDEGISVNVPKGRSGARGIRSEMTGPVERDSQVRDMPAPTSRRTQERLRTKAPRSDKMKYESQDGRGTGAVLVAFGAGEKGELGSGRCRGSTSPCRVVADDWQWDKMLSGTRAHAHLQVRHTALPAGAALGSSPPFRRSSSPRDAIWRGLRHCTRTSWACPASPPARARLHWWTATDRSSSGAWCPAAAATPSRAPQRARTRSGERSHRRAASPSWGRARLWPPSAAARPTSPSSPWLATCSQPATQRTAASAATTPPQRAPPPPP